MRVAFIAPQSILREALDGGLEAVAGSHDGARAVLLAEADADLTVPSGGGLLVLDIPEETLRRFELTNGSPAGGRLFEVPPSVADRFPVVESRGLSSNGERRGWPLPSAAMAALIIVLVSGAGLAAVLLAGGGDDADGGRPAAKRPENTRREAPRSKAPPRPKALRAKSQSPARRSQSRALGTQTDGRLVNGVALPAKGRAFFTWDFKGKRSPSPRTRRWATDHVVRRLLAVARRYRRAHPDAPRVGIADLSLRRGGDFGVQYGGTGHLSHQNGLDVDVLYPRRDEAEKAASRPEEIDRGLTRDLVRRFLRAGASFVTVGPGTAVPVSSRVRVSRFHGENIHVHFPKRAG